MAGPAPTDLTVSPLLVASEVLGRIRKAKSDAKVSMRADVTSVVVTDTAARLAALASAASDVRDAGSAAELTTVTADGPDAGDGDGAGLLVDVVLAPVAEG